MENTFIIISIFLLLFGGVLAWLCLSMIQIKTKYAVQQVMMDQIVVSIKSIDMKLNEFLKKELDMLKELIDKTR